MEPTETFEKIVETDIKKDVRKTLWPKWLTIPRMLIWGFFVLIPGIGISTAYLAKGVNAVQCEINENIHKQVIKVNDSVNCATQIRIKKLMMSSAKTNTYLEILMNEETKNVADSKWRRDSILIENNRY